MNPTLPNVDRGAPVKDPAKPVKDAASSEKDARKNGFEEVIDKVRDEKKIPDRKDVSKKSQKPDTANASAHSGDQETETSKTLNDLLKMAGALPKETGEAIGTATKTDDAGQNALSADDLALLAANMQTINSAMTAEQKTAMQLSSVTGLANEVAATSSGRGSTMAEVLNALNAKDLKGLRSEAGGSAKPDKTASGDVKTPAAGTKLDGSPAINLPQSDGKSSAAKQAVTDFLAKQNMAQSDPAASQTAGKPSSGGEVKVVSVETHLPPADLGRPAQQVANALTKQVPAAAAARAAEDLAAQTADKQAVKPIKALEIQLRPDNLGVVRANIQMRGGELEISLTASTREAADMLKGDRQALARVLQDAGYRTETQNITINFKDEMAGQMRQLGQNQERFGQGNNPEGSTGEGGAQHHQNEQPQTDYAGAGQNEADNQDIRSGIYL
ncbi:flagellar hook-length control protein FliK [Pseudovibrio japonicus]|uniref:Flagellar hook-length control protein FliK n=1 Tax=Pseudovibrio japonicus TaxID=366534 RepID=A0ABQ3DXW3_9HYPH|nr:flagellar hook-length control protein FliK [Pseudovibrio japonicus]GHB18489.1 flagellar hook-length control protein FliK [Pseudovibrio japonicus]